MSTTDARTGFRLPWNADQRSPDDAGTDEAPDGDGAAAADARPSQQPSADPRTPANGSGRASASAPARKPSKFLADLTRAMQAAAEAAREESLSRLQADAKGWVEQIHSRTADGATDLRRRADDEVAAIREWSKAEMARIREETDNRISTRKQRLEVEIEEYSAGIERRIEAVQARVKAFETEMAAFFERLLAEDDPSRFAALAESMPEPPPFDDLEADGDADVDAAVATQADREAAMVAIETAAQISEVRDAEATVAEAVAAATEPDFAAAEAEALAGVDAADDADLPVLDDEELNARLAHLVPAPADAAASSEPARTTVVVSGLVSVASIAGFKRHLGRLAGVQSVAVSSGPEGEFVFSVAHVDDTDLRAAIPGLPGFRAKVTGGSDDTIEVTARDPDPES